MTSHLQRQVTYSLKKWTKQIRTRDPRHRRQRNRGCWQKSDHQTLLAAFCLPPRRTQPGLKSPGRSLENPSVEKLNDLGKRSVEFRGTLVRLLAYWPSFCSEFLSWWALHTHTEHSVGMRFPHSQGSQDLRDNLQHERQRQNKQTENKEVRGKKNNAGIRRTVQIK